MNGSTMAKAKKKAKKKASRKPGPTARKPAARTAKAKGAKSAPSASSDWRQPIMERMRALIMEADPDMVEERKWRKPTNPAGVPVFSHDGIVCTLESYKNAVKLTFMQGGALPDPKKLFTAGFGGTRRAIDIPEGGSVDAAAFKALIKAAVAHNQGS